MICGADVADGFEPHEVEIETGNRITPFRTADGPDIGGVDKAIFLHVVHGIFQGFEIHIAVVAVGAAEICDDQAAVEKDK